MQGHRVQRAICEQNSVFTFSRINKYILKWSSVFQFDTPDSRSKSAICIDAVNYFDIVYEYRINCDRAE